VSVLIASNSFLYLQVMHDYGHKGVTNDFLVTSKDLLALRYNDRSPHENFHASGAFSLLLQCPGCNFLKHLTKVGDSLSLD
jgi:hypothetical protein